MTEQQLTFTDKCDFSIRFEFVIEDESYPCWYVHQYDDDDVLCIRAGKLRISLEKGKVSGENQAGFDIEELKELAKTKVLRQLDGKEVEKLIEFWFYFESEQDIDLHFNGENYVLFVNDLRTYDNQMIEMAKDWIRQLLK